MIQEIPLIAVPNQKVQTRIQLEVGASTYNIEVVTRRGRLYATIIQDGDVLVYNRALASFAPLEGLLMLIDSEGVDCPTWQELGERFRLLYLPRGTA